jgi:uncharacterized protein YciW
LEALRGNFSRVAQLYAARRVAKLYAARRVAKLYAARRVAKLYAVDTPAEGRSIALQLQTGKQWI